MLIPPFAGVGMKAYAKDGSDITDKVFMLLLDGFMFGLVISDWSNN